MNKNFKAISGCILSATLASSMIPCTVYAEEEDLFPTEKTETVYAILNGDGSTSKTIVSNWIHDEDGITNIKESLNLTDVENTKGSEKPSVKGNTYTWNVDGQDVYYQGNTTQQLPVSISIKYYLDGKEVKKDELEGKKGHLKCVISLNPNFSKVVNVNGKQVTIHPSYLCAGALTFAADQAENVTVSQGEVIREGDKQFVTFATIPGLESTLSDLNLDKISDSYKISDDIQVEADIDNCEMKDIILGMTNEFSLSSLNSIDEISQLTSGVDQLVSAANQIQDGSKQLTDGTSELIEKSAPLTQSGDKIRLLAASTDLLYAGATQVKDGVVSYTQNSSAVNQGLAQLNAGADQLAGSSQISTGMDQLAAGLAQYDATLKATQKQLGEGKEMKELLTILETSKKQIAGMQTAIDGSKSTLNTLATNLATAQTQLTALQTQLTTDLTNANKSIGAVNNTIEADNKKVANNNDKVTQYNQAITNVIASIDATIASLQTAATADGLTEEQKATINAQITSLNAQKAQFQTVGSFESLDSLESIDLSQLSKDLQTIGSLAGTLQDANKALTGLGETLTQASETLDAMETNLKTASGDLEKLDITGMMTQLTTYSDTFAKSSATLSGYMKQLDGGIGQLRQGIAQVSSGSDQLNAYNDQLVTGVVALQEGTSQLQDNKEQLNTMADGLETLADAFEQLNDGADQLYEGVTKFNAEGIDVLKEKVDLTTAEVDSVVALFNEISDYNEETKDFIGSPENAEVKTRFILRTE